MKTLASKVLLLAVISLAAGYQSASAQIIINIDFLAQRGSESASSNYTGDGAAGGSDFNGLVANNSASTDNITVAGTNLIDTAGDATGVNFTVGPIGADNHNGPQSIFNPTENGYLFLNSAGNSLTTTPFTISGLGAATTATLYFYENNVGYGDTFTVPGGTNAGFTGPGAPFNSMNTIEFTSVDITSGSIVGSFNVPQGTGVYSGLTIVYTPVTIPEPASYAFMLLGVGSLLGLTYLRRRRA